MNTFTVVLEDGVDIDAEAMLVLTGDIAPEPTTGVTAFAGMVACYE